MWKLLLVALLLLLPLPALAQFRESPAETLCTTDSFAIANENDRLQEGSHTVTVNWTASSNTLWYNVFRGTVNGGPYTLIAGCVTGTSYVDTVAPSQTFYYVLEAVNAIGVSGNSNQPTAQIPLFDSLSGSRAASVFSVTLGESLSTSDALTDSVSGPGPIQVSESLSTSDTLSASQSGSGPTRTLSESLTTSDSLSVTGNLGAQLPSAMVLGDHGMAAAGSCAFVLQILSPSGGFTSQSVVNWNGSPRPTAFFYPRVLRVAITAADLASGGRIPITVTTPGEGTVAAGTFSVIAGAPTISSYFPLGATLVVNGTNFVPRNTVVLLNGTQQLATTWYSPSLVQAWLPGGIFSLGGASVSITNSGCESDY